MRKFLFISFLLLFLSHFSFSQCFHNLDFEYFFKTRKESTMSFPISWANSVGGYVFAQDTVNKVYGKSSLLLKPITGFNDVQVATAYTEICIKDFAQFDTIIVEFSVRIDSLQIGEITLFSYLINKGNENLEGYSSKSLSLLKNTTSWETYKLELYKIKNATHLQIGFEASAPCYFWIDNITVYFDGKKYEEELVTPKQSEIDTLKKIVYPFEVKEESISQNKTFDDFFQNVNIVGLGECTHGSSEIFTTKTNFIKYLVENQNFEIVVFEAAMAECVPINNYIQTGEGNLNELLKGLNFWTWNTKEVYDLINWMRDYNVKNNKKLQIMGADMQHSKGAFSLLWAYANKNDNTLAELLKPLNTNLAIVDSLKNATQSSLIGNEIFIDVFLSAEKVKNYLLDLPMTEQNSLLLQYTEILLQYSVMNQNMKIFFRDSCLAQNVEWIYNNFKKKIVFWGHNGHIENSQKMMGGHLKRWFSSSYKSIGFLAGSGTYTATGWQGLSAYKLFEPQKETYEYLFSKLNYPMFFLNNETISCAHPELNFLCKPKFYRDIGAMASIYQFSCGNILNLFDGIVYIQETTASKCFLNVR